MPEDLSRSLSLASFADAARQVGPSSSLLAQLSSPSTFLDISSIDTFTSAIGFDTRRICAAHNIVLISKCADSVNISVLGRFILPFLDGADLEHFLVEVILANADVLGGTTIDQISGVVRFRQHTIQTAKWTENVLMSL